ncbi:Rgg/GadR/MutR family transcriptional regulator [Lactovum odontotermitis]
MLDSIIGQTFRELRQAKNIEIKEVANEHFSYPQISKFETGKSSITVEKLFDGLLSINVSLEEFSRAYYNNSGNGEFLFPTKLNEAYHSNNLALLKNMLREAKYTLKKFPEKSKYKLNLIVIKAVIKNLDSNYEVPVIDVKYLTNYLTTIEEFTSYEFWLFAYCVILFDNDTIIKIVKQIIHSGQNNLDFPSLRQRKYASILNSIDVLLKRECYEPLSAWLTYLDKALDSDLFIYEKVHFVYHNFIYELKQNPQSASAKEKLKDYFSALKLFKCFNLVNTTEREVNEFFPDYHI